MLFLQGNLQKRKNTVKHIYLHFILVIFTTGLPFFCCFPVSDFERSNWARFPAIIIAAVSGSAWKLPPKNKPVIHNRIHQYRVPDISAIIIFCLLTIMHAHFPEMKAAIKSIHMIQYPAWIHVIFPELSKVAINPDNDRVITMLINAEITIPSGIEPAFPVLLIVLSICPLPLQFTVWSSI